MRLKPYYVDLESRFALREMQADDLAGLENINKLQFWPDLRHNSPPAEFLDKYALAAEARFPAVLTAQSSYFWHGIVFPLDYSCLIGLVGEVIRSACAEDPINSVEVGYALLPAHRGPSPEGVQTSAGLPDPAADT